jgi:hypothetical protein
VEDQRTVEAIRQEIASAQTIVFLGFAYYAQNMALITPTEPESLGNIYGTAIGFSEDDCKVNMNYLLALFPAKSRRAARDGGKAVLRRDLSCDKLFDEYGRTFAGA